MKEKEIYREKIIEMVRGISNSHALEYIYIVIRDIVKELEGKRNGEN